MRLLLLTDWEYPCDHPFLEHVYVDRFADAGHEPVWVMRDSEERARVAEREWNGTPVYVLPDRAYDPASTFLKSVAGSLSTHPVTDIADRHGPFDIVHVRNDLSMGLVASFLKENDNVYFAHQISHLKAETLDYMARDHRLNLSRNTRAKYIIKGKMGSALRSRICSRADVVLPISDAMEEFLTEQGYQMPMVPVPTGAETTIDPGLIDPRPFVEAYDLPNEQLLLYMGSMSPIRELEFLFEVLARLRTETDAHLVMAGGRNEQYRRQLMDASEAAGVAEHVTFTGWISDDETLNQAICAADVGLSPIPPNEVLRTNAPLKVLEYLNLQTPVVATDTPDQRTVIENANGGAVVEYDAVAFATAIQQMLSSKLKRREMGRSGRRYVREHRSYERLFRLVLGIYDDLLDEETSAH